MTDGPATKRTAGTIGKISCSIQNPRSSHYIRVLQRAILVCPKMMIHTQKTQDSIQLVRSTTYMQ